MATLTVVGLGQQGQQRETMRVLLAEDDPNSQLITRRLLERHGHFVTIVGNGRAAVEALEHSRYDVVLMDIQMPLMDGFHATTEIRERERFKNFRTPIIAFTAQPDSESFVKAGMDGYIGKPPDTELLLATLESAAANADLLRLLQDPPDDH